MKKVLSFILVLALVLFLVSSTPIFAQEEEIDCSIRENEDHIRCRFTPEQPLTDTQLNELNPFRIAGSPQADLLSTPGGILSRVLLFAFPIAGGILLIMLLWAGFEMVAGATEKKSQDAGRQRATAAVIGFILLFVSYWIIRLLELVTGAKIF